MDWHGACIVPLYNGKGDKCKSSDSRSINLLSEVGNIRLLIKKISAGSPPPRGQLMDYKCRRLCR